MRVRPPARTGPARARALLAATVLAATAACGAPAAAPAGGETLTNCGIAVPVGAPPQRIFAAFHNAIEIVHALGAGDRLVGTAYLDNPILPEFAAAQQRPAYFPEEYPSREEVLRLDPDFVVAGFTGAFTTEGLGTRGELAELGIGSYLFTAYCPTSDGAGQDALAGGAADLEGVYGVLTDLGRVLGRPDLAADQVAAMRATVAEVESALGGVTDRPAVAMVNRPTTGGELRVFGGGDVAEEIIVRAGGTQVFADVPGRLVRVGIEELIRRAPEVIVIPACCGADVGPQAAQPLVDELLADPALANVPAVRDRRVVAVTFAEVSPGIRNADAVATLARLLHPDRFAG